MLNKNGMLANLAGRMSGGRAISRVAVVSGMLLASGGPGLAAEPGATAAVSMPPADIAFPSAVGEVRFPHVRHLKFGCAACHHQIRAGALDTPHPDYLATAKINCAVCHDAEPAPAGPVYRCSDCHHSEPETIADETLSAKVVVHRSCWKCHKSGTGVEASRGCGDCHVKEEPNREASDG